MYFWIFIHTSTFVFFGADLLLMCISVEHSVSLIQWSSGMWYCVVWYRCIPTPKEHNSDLACISYNICLLQPLLPEDIFRKPLQASSHCFKRSQGLGSTSNCGFYVQRWNQCCTRATVISNKGCRIITGNVHLCLLSKAMHLALPDLWYCFSDIRWI